jgi:Icc-related predicted phosphoesterase
MKILAFADMHGNEHIIKEIIKLAKLKKPNLMICLGDLTIFGQDLSEILSKFDKVGISLLVIPGNHEEGENMKKICNKFKNIIYLHRGVFEIGNYAFFGYGGGGFSQEDEEFDKVAKVVEKKIKGKKIVFITHQPPYSTKLDYLEYFEHVGNKSYRRFIKKNKPILGLSGHLHENFGEMDSIGESILINPGPLGKLIKI